MSLFSHQPVVTEDVGFDKGHSTGSRLDLADTIYTSLGTVLGKVWTTSQ